MRRGVTSSVSSRHRRDGFYSHTDSAVLRTAEALGYHHVWVVAPPTLDIDAAIAKEFAKYSDIDLSGKSIASIGHRSERKSRVDRQLPRARNHGVFVYGPG